MNPQRELRIAAIGDLHYDPRLRGTLRALFSDICREAHVLAICGDMTTHGQLDQIGGFLEEIDGVDIPMIAVLGNHDCESGHEEELCARLTDRGIHVLDGDNMVIEGVGFAGVKGFGGGFGVHTLGAFGEQVYKDFVQAALDEALKLETALRTLDTETRVVLLHYAPIRDTVVGEPEEIIPFLGTSRLIPPIDTHGASVVFHGHAHIGTVEGTTPGGVPVYNVAHKLLARTTGKGYRIWTAPAPERREQF